MAVYCVVLLKIHDRETYDRYAARFPEVFAPYGGRVLAVDEHARVLEGESDKEKVVLLEFPDEERFQAWAQSPEYQEIAKDRWASSDAVAFLAQGLS